MARVWQIDDIPATTKLVLLKLADNADDQGGNAYPAVDTIARACGLNRRTVQRILRRLGADGWDGGRLMVDRNATARSPVVYRLVWTEGRQDVTPEAAGDPERGGVVPPDPSRDPSVVQVLDLRSIWNDHRGPCRACRHLDATRQRHTKARIDEQPDPAVWVKTAQWLARSSWSNGSKNGWKADFSYFVRPTTWVRAMESDFRADGPVETGTVRDRTRRSGVAHVSGRVAHIRE